MKKYTEKIDLQKMVRDWYKALSEQEKNQKRVWQKWISEYDWTIKEYRKKIQTKYMPEEDKQKRKKQRKNTEKISTICWNK